MFYIRAGQIKTLSEAFHISASDEMMRDLWEQPGRNGLMRKRNQLQFAHDMVTRHGWWGIDIKEEIDGVCI